jgi:PAT family beta-lactamase induction signal transducer AmpG
VSLAERPRLRLFALCSLYLAQGIPWGFMVITLPAYLAERGLDAGEVGATMAITYLPWSFKWVWGPVIDSISIPSLGRRRPWILLAQAMMAVTVIAMIAIPDLTTGLVTLSWMILIHNVFNSLQDVAVDALAVDLLDEKERGRANGLMYGSKYLGGVIGGAGMATVIGWSGLKAALVVQTVILLAIMMVPLLLRERPPGAPVERSSFRRVVVELWRAFRIRSALVAAVLSTAVIIASGMLSAIASVLYTQKLGWSDVEYSQFAGGPALFLGLGGSVVGGFFADRVGHRRLAAIASITLAVIWVGFALIEPWWQIRAAVIPFMLLEQFLIAAMSVSLWALLMDVSTPAIAATQFTAYMALFNLSNTLGFKLAGPAERTFEYYGIFLVAAAIQLAVTAILFFIDPHETRRKLAAA